MRVLININVKGVIMTEVKSGDTIRVHYTGTLEDGAVFDSSKEKDPLEFTVGGGNLIPGFENGVIGMKIGDTKKVTIPAEEAYGPRQDDMVIKIDRKEFPQNITPEVGMPLQMQKPDGGEINVIITGVETDSVTLDANHPLAGETLIFELEIVEFV